MHIFPDKKPDLIPTIFLIILIYSTNEIYVDNL